MEETLLEMPPVYNININIKNYYFARILVNNFMLFAFKFSILLHI